jgi:hypothetical protein
MANHFYFYIGLIFIIIHEMDAVRCKEWRMFPGLSLLNDDWGFKIFMFAHIPLYFLIYWKLANTESKETFIYGVSIFFIIHFALHLLFLLHKKNEFKDWISWLFIFGAGFFGLLDLILN